VWKYPVYATRDTHIDFNDRICQFRIVKKQPTIIFEKVDHLDGKSRGGFGSSGIK
jgi:dUTP pyrophosphatase